MGKLEKSPDKYRYASDLHDLLGVRVITHFSKDVDLVVNALRAEFDIDEAVPVDRSESLEPDAFGYRSSHLHARLGERRLALTEWAPYAALKFEIQVRSILQHAWAEIEHDLGYKSPEVVPKTIVRRFALVAGLLELADSEFDNIRERIATHVDAVDQSVSSGEDVPIDRDSVHALIESSSVVNEYDKQIAEMLGTVLDDEVSASYASSRAEELLEVGYRSTGEVERVLREVGEKTAKFAAAWFNVDLGVYDSSKYPNGEFRPVTKGVILFYLYLHKLQQLNIIDNGLYGISSPGMREKFVQAHNTAFGSVQE